MKTKIIAALSLFAGICALAPEARAEDPKKSNDYEYRFGDDSLLAASGSAAGPVITVIKMARRDRLLRLRTHFVPEMLKSVENM